MLSDQYISVSDLNSYVKTYLENNYFLQDLYIKGEISNFKRHQSGTLYFAIKDENATVNVVMFQSYANKIKVALKDGDLVLIRGRISVYEARGTYSINATEVLFDSKGMLLIQFEQLKEKLLNEGLFDDKYKKPIPKYPFKIGLITAPYGAAVQDMLRTIKSRWPIAEIIVFPSLVQGSDASADILKNIELADNYNLDVLIVGRGGGSIEDLWPFNEENVARAIFDCNTPIISSVGHEIDTTISDYVADARGLTPTDGAIKATPNINDVINKICELKSNLSISLNNIIKFNKERVNNLKHSYVLTNPTKIYDTYRYKIDELENDLFSLIKDVSYKQQVRLIKNKEKLNSLFKDYLVTSKNKFYTYTGKLDSLSPLKVLNRGYAFASISKKIIKKVDDVSVDEVIDLSLSDGIVKTKVISKEKH